MALIETFNPAFGFPGLEPRWTHGGKDAIGTAASPASRIWFTLWNGIVTEVFYPTIDRPQIRDLQLLITDGASFFHDERRHLRSRCEQIARDALAYRITNEDPQGRYTIVKEIIAGSAPTCLLQHTRLLGDDAFLDRLQLYVLCAPHLQNGGWHNNALVAEVAGRRILAAEKDGMWLALAATLPYARLSCGYVGASDGWTDLATDFKLDWTFDNALDGNGLAFGDSLHSAATALFQSLGLPFLVHKRRYVMQGQQAGRRMKTLDGASGDYGELYHRSYAVLLAHQDKTFAGATIASLAIPWGEMKGDGENGAYHLVWTRDMVNSAMAMLAAGNQETPLRALIYLAATQNPDGGFAQNFWIDGTAHWLGIQLDEVAFPILLASRLADEDALQGFDPYPIVMRAAQFLVRHGPVTEQERWEEAAGYSPSNLAATIAALVCAARFARIRQEETAAQYLEAYADFIEDHLEEWTVTTRGRLHPEVSRHYMRINPAAGDPARTPQDAAGGMLSLPNLPPGAPSLFEARDLVDAGFLELVRYGIRAADDPLIVDSLRVIDAVLRVDTPFGPCWRRYNNDGYGQRPDGSGFDGWGQGRAWPLLSAERGYYELAANRSIVPFIRAMEGFASVTGLLPEQVWDAPDLPDVYMRLGHPTGAAMPLAWAHAEYIKLLRCAHDGVVFDRIACVADRYLSGGRRSRVRREIWSPNRKVDRMRAERTLRVQMPAPFALRWSRDYWQTIEGAQSTSSGVGVYYIDIAPGATAELKLSLQTQGREAENFSIALQAE